MLYDFTTRKKTIVWEEVGSYATASESSLLLNEPSRNINNMLYMLIYKRTVVLLKFIWRYKGYPRPPGRLL